jgi:hypothetical protein
VPRDDQTERPTWILSAEHGALGEARAKALLLERFWVLERSVDVHGVDFLIQRRLLRRNPFDLKPPTFGSVQAKFVQDGRTPIRIPAMHVRDAMGSPLEEFFLLVFTGLAVQKRVFLLSASEVVSNFRPPAIVESDKLYYQVSANQLLSSKRFEVLDSDRALDRIDHALERADFVKNRRQLIAAFPPYFHIDPSDIDDDYQVPLDNWYGDLGERFFSFKRDIETLLLELYDIIDPLQKVLQSTDPLEAYSLIEERLHWNIDDRGRLSFNSGDLLDEDFVRVLVQHKKRLEALRKNGTEATYLHLQGELRAFIIRDLAIKLPLNPGQTYVVSVHFDPATLSVHAFTSSITDDSAVDTNRWPMHSKVMPLSAEKVNIVYYPNEWFGSATLFGSLEDKEQALRKRASLLSQDFMEWLDDRILAGQ